MEKDRKIYPLYHYPIDDYPIDMNEFIKPYEAGLNELKDDNVCGMLYVGLLLYKSQIKDSSTFYANPEVFKFSIDLFAYTGFIPDYYLPNETVAKKLFEAPEIAVTDLDKAILGLLITFGRGLTIGLDQQGKNYRDIFHSFIYFLYNAQRYEQKTKRTIVFSGEMNDSYVYNILTNPSFSEIESDAIMLSDSDVEYLSRVLLYREELHKLIEEARAYEKEYVINEQNNADWELFISCVNHRTNEEKRVTNLINSDISVSQKLHEFKKYFEEIDAIPDTFNSSMSLRELTDRIIKRTELAPNFIWVRAGDDKVLLDDSIVSSVLLPYSFNCVLIAYHAFLIEMSSENITRLIHILNIFIGNNLGQKIAKHKNFDNLDSIEKTLVNISAMILDFFEKHKNDIASIKYNVIQNEETLSGFGFDWDIYKRVIEKERKMAVENANAFKSMDDEWEDFIDGLDELFDNVASEDDINDDLYKDIYSLKKDFESHFPYVFDNEKKLIDREIGNRLILSINAIYVLVKVMDRLLEHGLIHDEYKYSIINSSKLLSGLERYLVATTYVPPSYNCFDDYDMAGYRERNGIDASVVELQNNERMEIALMDSARRSIQALHEEIHDISYEKAVEIKSQLRDEIKEYPDNKLKDFIVELIDQICQDICNSLIESKSNTADFETIKKQVQDYIGPSSVRLPDETINALSTAEMLFSQYAISENTSNGFDYSGISALYYQAVESMYNGLLWGKYAAKLNAINENGDWFSYLYKHGRLPTNLLGYLPTDKPNYFMNKEKNRIASALTMGNFNYVFFNATSKASNPLPFFKSFLVKEFGFDSVPANTPAYKDFQDKIDIFHKQLDTAIPKRNNASHGHQPVSLEECKTDKRIVLSDVEGLRNNVLGLIMLFLSLYKE